MTFLELTPIFNDRTYKLVPREILSSTARDHLAIYALETYRDAYDHENCFPKSAEIRLGVEHIAALKDAVRILEGMEARKAKQAPEAVGA